MKSIVLKCKTEVIYDETDEITNEIISFIKKNPGLENIKIENLTPKELIILKCNSFGSFKYKMMIRGIWGWRTLSYDGFKQYMKNNMNNEIIEMLGLLYKDKNEIGFSDGGY